MPPETPKLDTFSVGSSNVIKNITQEILRECNKENIVIEEHVVSYAINLISLDPLHGLKLSTHFDRSKLENFVKMCVAKFSNLKNPSFKTLQMQVKFMMNPIDIDKIISSKREQFRIKSLKFVQEILDSQILGKGDREKLMKNMTIDAIVYNGLGNPSNTKVYNETFQVLESIMCKSDVTAFTNLPTHEKMNTLNDVREIICGIRIFNKDAGHSAEGVIDLPTFVEQTCDSTKSILDINLFEVVDRVNLLTSAVDAILNFEEINREYHVQLPDGISAADLETLKDVLIMSRQQELYIRYLIEYLVTVTVQSGTFIQTFRKILEEIHAAVQYKTAVATELIFPRFSELGKIWIKLQNQIFVLSQINFVMNNLTELAAKIEPYSSIAYAALSTNEIQTDEQRLDKSTWSQKNEPHGIVNEIIVEYSDKVKIELLGFCVNSLAEGRGMLVPGNPQLGLIHYKNRYYATKSANGLKSFLKNPEKIIFSLIDTARKKPELIVFLDIFDQIRLGFEEYPEMLQTDKHKVSIEMGCQTEVHPVPFRKEKDYVWNVWDLRRRAIQLANIKNSRTSALQTNITYERFTVETQTFELRGKDCQTRRDAGTNVKPNKILLANHKGKDVGIDCREHFLIAEEESKNFIDCLEEPK